MKLDGVALTSTHCLMLLSALALLAVACGSDGTDSVPEPRPDPVPAETALVLGLTYGQHKWLGEIRGEEVVRQVWLPNAQFALAPTTWFLEGGILQLPALDGPESHGFRIWELEIHSENNRRPTAYADPALASLQWGADGSLLHLDSEPDRGPLVRVVDMPAGAVESELILGMPGAINVRMRTSADGKKALILSAAQGWAVAGSLEPEGWAISHSLGPGIEQLKANYVALGSERGVLLRGTAARTFALQWIDLESPDLRTTHSSTYPHQLSHSLVDPDDEVALLVGEAMNDPDVFGWTMWHPPSDTLVDLAHLDLTTLVALLPSPEGVRIVDGRLGNADGVTWLDWYDVAIDGSILTRGRFELDPPPTSGWEPTRGIAPVLTGPNPWGGG